MRRWTICGLGDNGSEVIYQCRLFDSGSGLIRSCTIGQFRISIRIMAQAPSVMAAETSAAITLGACMLAGPFGKLERQKFPYYPRTGIYFRIAPPNCEFECYKQTVIHFQLGQSLSTMLNPSCHS